MGTWIKLSANSAPKQYLKGWVEFYKLKFKVDGRVLIPRPETELLIDEVISFTKSNPKSASPTILDIGTGSGNIAIALAKNLKPAKIFATDISEEVLELARENAQKHKVQDKIFFIQSDLLSAFSDSSPITNSPRVAGEAGHSSLVIVTNLPYIPRGRIPYLDPSVKDFEPWIALDGGPDGFDLYRKLFQQISNAHSWSGKLKLIVGEIDYTQGELAILEAQKYFPKAKVEVKTDLAHKQRILLIRF